MGRKADEWRRQRAVEQGLAPDLSQLRPAGMADHQAETAEPVAQRHERRPYGAQVASQRGTLAHVMDGLGLREARQRFLDLYAERGTMIECCRLAGLSWRAIDNARENDPEFARAFQEAEQCVLEKLEREAMRRAVEGTVIRSRKFWHGQLVGEDIRTEYSDNLLMMLLRAKAPSTYRDNSMITINQVIKAVEGFDPSVVLGNPALPPG